jgi:hypothetical protein
MNPRILAALLLVAVGATGLYWWLYLSLPEDEESTFVDPPLPVYQPRENLDTSGFTLAKSPEVLKPWEDPNSLEQIRAAFHHVGYRFIKERINPALAGKLTAEERLRYLLAKASLLMYEGDPHAAYQVLEAARTHVKSSLPVEARWLYTVIFFQGVAGLRRGEVENCLECRGQGACIFPIRPTAVHVKPEGSRLAICHFSEYLEKFPKDIGVRWLLNLAYMTLGKHPQGVPAAHRMTFDHFGREADAGHFEDISHRVGLNRQNWAGGAVLEDFDNDGLLDLVVTSSDPTQAMAFYRNKGDGTFEDRTEQAGLTKQYGGLNACQTDYNNDGHMDIFIARGAWFQQPMRPSLLRNNGNGTFTDVTIAAGLVHPVNSNCGAWGDYDNDGYLDLYLCNETGPNRLYRNKRDGTFEEVAAQAGVQGKNKMCKGAVWFDYDNDGRPDLFVSYFQSTPQLFHNNGDGTFTDVTAEMGIDGPRFGFSCWAFDYDNDGHLDLFATCYERTLDDVVADLMGLSREKKSDLTRLYRNLGGKKFQDVSKEMGVDKVFATMGSNFADFDNDGYLDFYLATGEPPLSTLVPNRMFKNMAGKRFAEITATSGTGHLQKGHGVACGDWDRDGNVDLFVETGGTIPGDRYHNLLFQNPGHGNHWLNVKLVGVKTNRPGIGARIKVVTVGERPLTVHRCVSSGSSFGANPLEQHIGLGKARRVARLEIRWPTSGSRQVFEDLAVDRAIEVTEFARTYRKLNWKRVKVPRE